MNGYQHRPRPGTDGHLLTRAREARDWGRSEMARRLRGFSIEAGHPINPGRDGVWYWEHGRSPDRATQALIAGLLGIPPAAVGERPWPEWLAEDPAQRPAPRPWTPAGAAEALSELAGGSVENTRRELILIAGGTLTAALLSWLIADPAAAGQIGSGRRIGEATVARLEERASTLRRIDDEDGGGTVLTETTSALALTVSLIRDRSYTSGHGARLYAVVSDLARQRAAALFDVHGECADGAFETALRAAKAAGDDPLGANCLAFWANAAYNTGRPRDAEAMASTAVAAVRGRTTPRVQAMLESRRGRARARLGDPACWASFDQAEQLLSQASGHANPDWSYWFDQAEVYGARASSRLDLSQPALAEADFTTARGLFDPSIVRTQALYLTRQAIAQADQEHIEQAAATGAQALDVTQSISSSRTTSLLADLAGTLGAHQAASAQDFCERVRAVLAD